jgi:hypothetical protein
MEHVVFYAGPDAVPAFRRFSSLDEAVRFVEHLRNVEGVEDVSVNLLTPVPVAFRAYYKVEVPSVEVAAVPEQPTAVESVVPMPVDPLPMDLLPVDALSVDALPTDLMPAEDVAADVPVPMDAAPTANGKRSLGFFAH